MILTRVLLTGTGLLLVALAIPLMLRRVKPNDVYGLRVAATFADEWVWYEANALSGRDLMVLGVIQTSLAVVLPLLGAAETAYVVTNIIVLLGGTMAFAIAGVRRANALLARRRAETAAT